MVATAVDIRECSIADIRERSDLHAANDAESGFDGMPLCVDWGIYGRFEELDMLLCLGAYADDALVGYGVWTVSKMIHRAAIAAQCLVLYVDQEWRSRFSAQDMLREAARKAKDRGARYITGRGMEGSAYGRVLLGMGYHVTEVEYCKEL